MTTTTTTTSLVKKLTAVVACTVALLWCVSSLSTPRPRVTRRDAILETTAAATLSLLTAMTPFSAHAANGSQGAEAFVGTYTDPNHPGGTRTVRLVGPAVGDYQLAQVDGGGGRGEPDQYVLPAAILGDRAIVIDFSVPPKNGPKDFVGVLDDKKSIQFLKDGNVWPRQQSAL
jgi:hypothetical protein